MKKFILTFLCAVTIGGNLTAYSASTVREDRIWEHYSSYGGTTLFQSRFFGVTELNGKLYHNLVFTKKIHCLLGNFKQMNDASDEEVFLMREENGVIYLVRNSNWRDEYGLCGTAPQEEMVVCDFNCEAGDSFHSISALSWIGQYGNHIREFYENTFHVASTDSIEVNGEMCKRMFIDRITNPNGEEKIFNKGNMPEIVEGMMGVNGGILPVMSATVERFNDQLFLGRLTHVYDLDHKIIYEGYKAPLQNMDLSLPEMLVKDYRWEYWLSSADGSLNEIVSMEFDGERCIGDKTYRVLRSRRDAEWKYGEGVVVDYVNREQKHFEREYLLREEDGKVYLLNDIYSPDQMEFIVYDFTLDRTFPYTGVESNCYPGCEEDPMHKCYANPTVFNVSGVIYAGNEDRNEFRKIYTFESDYSRNAGSPYDIIRQADDAASFNSMLPFTAFRPSEGSRYDHVRLNNVYDKDGNIIFIGENEVVPEDSYVPLIREDRVWEYVHFTSPWDYSPELWKAKFDGAERINNKVYHVFKPISHIAENAHKTGYEEITEFGEDTFRYLREEYGKVYYLHPRNISINDLGNYTVPPKEEWEETLLYDFRQKSGGYFWITASEPMPESEYYRMLIPIESTDRIDIAGEACKVLSSQGFPFDNVSFDMYRNIYCEDGNEYRYYSFDSSIVEGIGFDGIGTMTFIPSAITTNGEPDIRLNNVYNADGDIIYKGTNVKITDGVEHIATDDIEIKRDGDSWIIKNVTRIVVYDLQGNEMTRYNGSGSGSNVRLSSQDYQSGFYIVKATSGSAMAVRIIRM